MSSSNQICENGGLMRPPYRVKYPSGESYPKVRISGDTSGDLTLQVLLSSRQDDKVALMINYGPSRVSFMDLVGNGPEPISRNRHQKGYGKLLVNLAIQVLQRSPWINSQTRIHGTITDDRPAVATFWRNFGLSVTGPGEGKHGLISGKLGDLEPVQRDYRAGDVFPLSLKLSHFVSA
ncbi:hypothetical protein ACFOHT_03000 [Massilia oculi]|uniref:hypothetical protein n=1 Tax=Massilia oculi TaxID=945844 RepID=UPI0013B4376B|nr:hypothetical protein [Massilia oculi]